MKNCILNDNIKWMIAHYHENIIHLTDSSDSSANEESSVDDEDIKNKGISLLSLDNTVGKNIGLKLKNLV